MEFNLNVSDHMLYLPNYADNALTLVLHGQTGAVIDGEEVVTNVRIEFVTPSLETIGKIKHAANGRITIRFSEE